MAFSALATISLLVSKIIFRFVRHPEQLAILRAPRVITKLSAWDAAIMDRMLSALEAAAARGGRAALEQLARRFLEMHAKITAHLVASRASATSLASVSTTLLSSLAGTALSAGAPVPAVITTASGLLGASNVAEGPDLV